MRNFRLKALFGWWRGMFLAGLVMANAGAADAIHASAPLGVGATFDTLQAGRNVFTKVEVRSVTARALVITHAGGMASIRLRDLSPELQRAFGYDPQADAAADAALAEAEARAKAPRPRAAPPTPAAGALKSAPGNSQMEGLLQRFGQPPEIRALVDLRPKYVELGLHVKNQGPRPSCAVFAVVSTLEFLNAQLTGQAERFSEEYLIWATCKTLQRAPRVGVGSDTDVGAGDTADPADEGFSLSEVVTALRAYGIPRQTTLPYSFSRTLEKSEPSREVIAEARDRRRVAIVPLPGRDVATKIANLVHALNAGVPIAVGLRWPQYRTIRGGYLDRQPPLPDSGHGVAIVGYENKTGAISDTVFIFKNSWGARWGVNGYGYATYVYLSNNLEETALIEITAP